jgi:hypothetical protein
MKFTRVDLYNFFLDNNVNYNENIIKKVVEETTKDVLQLNLLGVTSYKTKFYPYTKEFMDTIVNELKDIFEDSNIQLEISSSKEIAIIIVWKFI